eukprot:a842815_39.p1 GENE.a842815_39~~a842815_39.p1  ORF type:complete len:454 (-),score=165.44 a842815_39:541-1875(-)
MAEVGTARRRRASVKKSPEARSSSPRGRASGAPAELTSERGQATDAPDLSSGMGSLALLALFCLGVPTVVLAQSDLSRWAAPIGLGCMVSVLGFALSYVMIPAMAPGLDANQLYGIDINKFDRAAASPEQMALRPHVPEGLGIVCGVSFLVCCVLYQVGTRLALVPEVVSMGEYNAALHSVCFMVLLGFVDDVVDLRWRYKLVLPALATLPLLVAYSGSTSVVVPLPLRAALGETVDLGLVYTCYMGCVAVFCTNAINIYAGINGLEAGQSFVIACAVLTHNAIELANSEPHFHVFSISLMLPFAAVTLALLCYNWYPSSVFVGDTYTYFAGMSLAVVAILGHFSKTLMLFCLPQILNFVLSLFQILIGPMLFGTKCPRHRLARYNPQTKLLECVPAHHNLLNLYLWFSGPLSERALARHLVVLQIVSCAFGFFVRYYVAAFFY